MYIIFIKKLNLLAGQGANFNSLLFHSQKKEFLDQLLEVTNILQKQPSIGFFKKSCSENMQQIYRRTPIPKCDFNKVAKHASAWVFSCKFAACFQNTSGRPLLILLYSISESLCA